LDDREFMQAALDLAAAAAAAGEVPVGAVVVAGGEIIGRGANRPIASCDPTAHAEIVALREAALAQRSYRLSGATLYVTLEPCAMCAQAIIHARVRRLVFGAWDPRAGAVDSAFQILNSRAQNHPIDVLGGVLGGSCGDLLRGFFRERRDG
jgi:tRNA(adenine34) deaminase